MVRRIPRMSGGPHLFQIHLERGAAEERLRDLFGLDTVRPNRSLGGAALRGGRVEQHA